MKEHQTKEDRNREYEVDKGMGASGEVGGQQLENVGYTVLTYL